MKYTIKFTDTTKSPLEIESNTINTDTTLKLYGQGSVNYGAELWINLLKLLDHSCSGGVNHPGPSKPVAGQLWFNNYSTNLNLYKTNKWVPIVDSQYLNSLYGSGGIDGLINKLGDALLDNTNPTIINFLTELNKTLLPISGGTISGKLFLPKIDSYTNVYNKANLDDANKVVSIEYLKWFVLEFAKNYVPPNSPGFDDCPYGIGYDTDPTLLPDVPPYLPLKLSNNTTVKGLDITFNNNVLSSNPMVNTVVDDADAVNKKYVNDNTSSTALMNTFKNSNAFKNAIATEIDNLIKAPTAPASPISPTLKSYQIQDNLTKNGKGLDVTNTGLTLSILPQSTNSKFLITISLILSNGTKSGTAIGSLYKNDVALLSKFCVVDGTNLDAMPYGVTFLDSVSTMDKVTYTVKVNGDTAGGEWYYNQSSDGTNKSTSSMTIMEFVGNTTIVNNASSLPASSISSTPTITSTTTAYVPKIGEVYKGGFYMGDITDAGVKYRILVSPKGVETRAKWRSSSAPNTTMGVTSLTDGLGNTAKLTAVKGVHLAADYCADLSLNGYEDWYLPSHDELKQMYKNHAAKPFSIADGFASSDSSIHWSSSEDKNGAAWEVHLLTDNSHTTNAETNVYNVRAVRREPY